jgi:hypothetical protein
MQNTPYEGETTHEWITRQPWSEATTRLALDVAAQREASGRPPLTFNQWLAWIKGRRA